MFGNERPRRTKADILANVAPGYTDARFVARNTVRRTDPDGSDVIRFHLTDIVRVTPSGRVTIRTDGWATPTTRERVNEWAPPGFCLFAREGVEYVTTPAGTFAHVDGAEYHSTGRPVRPSLHVARPDDVKRLKQAIADMVARVKREGLPLPDNGDPFVAPDPTTGKYAEHYVRGWLSEGYLFGTLCVNALRYRGNRPEAFPFGRGPRASGVDVAAMALRRYLKACLSLA